MPGGIDPHTHFELEMMGAKTADDFYKGTRAAVAGGTTTISKFLPLIFFIPLFETNIHIIIKTKKNGVLF